MLKKKLWLASLCALGGVKESGLGSECGMEGLQAYCNTKLVSEE